MGLTELFIVSWGVRRPENTKKSKTAIKSNQRALNRLPLSQISNVIDMQRFKSSLHGQFFPLHPAMGAEWAKKLPQIQVEAD